MKKIVIDKKRCIGCGECWYTSDSVFDQARDGKAKLRYGVTHDRFEIEEAEKAMINCPVDAISVVNDSFLKEEKSITSVFDVINSILDWANSDSDDD